MTDKSEKKLFKRVLIVLFGLPFIGYSVFAIVGMMINSESVSQTPVAQQQNTPETELLEKAKGYEMVLQREPNNPMALQGLVETRLQMNDLKGAIPPMEKLVQLYPDNQELKNLLSFIQQQVSIQPETPSNTEKK